MTMVDTGRATMTGYLDALVKRGDYGKYFADDVWLQVVGSDQEAHGAQAVEGMIRFLHEQAFDATPEVRTLVVDGDHASIEAVFAGRHAAEFAGIAATGKQVHVPYSVGYDLEAGRIKTLRIYGFLDGLLAQIRA